jgi:pimeloyl-ACP methyl ester carboxylesterase
MDSPLAEIGAHVAIDKNKPRHRRLQRPLPVVSLVLGAAVTLYLALLAALWFAQERLLFHPVPLDPAHALATQADVHESMVDVPGARLSLLELRLPAPKGVVFFLHGNAGNLQDWFVNTALYRQANFDLVMLDYRGYGKSTGRIESEAQLHADVQQVWEQVAPRYQGRRVVFYGRSLGTGLAAALAAKLQPDLTMLASPYRSMVALAAEHYPWVPTAVLRYPLRTDQQLGRIRTPVVLLHGERDELIPVAHSRALAGMVTGVQLVVVPGAGHGDLQDFDSYVNAVRASLQSL